MRDVMIGYGLTEASGGVSQTAPDDTLERRVGTVGRPHPHVEMKIIDPEGCIVGSASSRATAPVQMATAWV
jgi:fatty-acyl-CoA synthase